eukprot:TRINITY_DN5714_c0_g1_i4.p2 TRINITY_DN5714_c0_g1~~TRINITY_DN5714_c0_g1_i4.p2  ORF type:complete len:311 (-),score=65.62 TRINITY_DN5714_c0_g1_i4:42-974(-)
MPLITKVVGVRKSYSKELIGELCGDGSYVEVANQLMGSFVELDSGVLYVAQREFATILPASNPLFNWIGSGAATTCIILLFYCPSSQRSSVGHLDGSDGQVTGRRGCSLLEMLSTFPLDEQEAGIQCHLVGGYCDEDQTSKNIIIDIVRVLCACKANIHLETFFVDTQNTVKKRNFNAPRTQGAALHIGTGKLFLVSKFLNRGPEMNPRYMNLFLGAPQLVNVWNAQTNRLTIGPFVFRPWTREAKRLLSLSDYDLLHNTSSSPEVEESQFVEDTREGMKWIISNPDSKAYFQGRPKTYHYQPQGWIKTD